MKSPSSTKKMIETGIFRFFNLFMKICKTGNKYNANKIEDRTEPWLILMLTSKNREEKSF